ncbi:MAG TPA: DUF1993 domain-containing protein [Gammaproteobacteria bacterium]|nr:DUF1993 domain-containing protein [Gammaproteobacteria bacterium]
MSLSMYQASVPVFERMLANLTAILKKGEAHAQAHKFDPQVLVDARLYPDMFSIPKQVQIACDMAKNGTARLAGIEPPKFEDNERTLAELYARIDKTLDFIKTVKPEQIDGSEERKVEIITRGKPRAFTGQRYLFEFVLPNLFFHVTTAYDILRHNGVELGKRDYIGPHE